MEPAVSEQDGTVASANTSNNVSTCGGPESADLMQDELCQDSAAAGPDH